MRSNLKTSVSSLQRVGGDYRPTAVSNIRVCVRQERCHIRLPVTELDLSSPLSSRSLLLAW